MIGVFRSLGLAGTVLGRDGVSKLRWRGSQGATEFLAPAALSSRRTERTKVSVPVARREFRPRIIRQDKLALTGKRAGPEKSAVESSTIVRLGLGAFKRLSGKAILGDTASLSS